MPNAANGDVVANGHGVASMGNGDPSAQSAMDTNGDVVANGHGAARMGNGDPRAQSTTRPNGGKAHGVPLRPNAHAFKAASIHEGVHPRFAIYDEGADDDDECDGDVSTACDCDVSTACDCDETDQDMVEGADERVARLFKDVLTELGEDVRREGIVKTPKRYAKALGELLSGYGKSAAMTLGGAIFHEKRLEAKQARQTVLVANIEFFSTHVDTLLPFFGHCHVAYVPEGGRIAGLSKFARLVHAQAKRLQTQDGLVQAVADAVSHFLGPRGVVVMAQSRCLTDVSLDASAPPPPHTAVAWRGEFMPSHANHASSPSLSLSAATPPTIAAGNGAGNGGSNGAGNGVERGIGIRGGGGGGGGGCVPLLSLCRYA